MHADFAHCETYDVTISILKAMVENTIACRNENQHVYVCLLQYITQNVLESKIYFIKF